MIIVRGIDSTGDWLYGKSQQDYKSANNAIMQNIQTRLLSFLGDCFFAIDDGLDWWNLLGQRNNAIAIQLAVNACIINTEGVTSFLQSSLNISAEQRTISITYSVTTIYTGSQIITNTLANAAVGHLLTQGLERLTTQTGQAIIT